MNPISHNGSQAPSLYQSIGSSKSLFKTIQNYETEVQQMDDFNIVQGNKDDIKFGSMKDKRQQFIQKKRSSMHSQMNNKSNIPSEMSDSSLMQDQSKKVLKLNSIIGKEEDEQGEQSSQYNINPINLSKRRIRIENNNLNKSPVISFRQGTIENQQIGDTGISFNNNQLVMNTQKQNVTIEEGSKNENNYFHDRIDDDEESIQGRRSNSFSRKQMREASLGATLIKSSADGCYNKNKKNLNSVKFSDANVFHTFEDSEKVEFIAQFMQEQKDNAIMAKQKVEGDDNILTKKSILKKVHPLKRWKSKSSQIINIPEEDNKSNTDTPVSQTQARKRLVQPILALSNFVKISDTNNPQKVIKKARKTSVFGKLKGSYEKDNYIKRLSSIQHLNLERFHQLIKKNESVRIRYQKIFLSVFFLIKNILSLNTISVDKFNNSTIHFYSVTLQCFKMFQNTSATGIIFFLYCYFHIDDFSTEVTWPITSPQNSIYDKNDFISEQKMIVAHLGFILQILLILYTLYGVLSDSCLFSEKQAVRLIFNSIKWNTFCSERHSSLKKKYKLYDKIMEDKDIHEGKYPKLTLSVFIIVQICLLSMNTLCLYFVLDDSRIPSQLSSISIFQKYSILNHIVIGCIIELLMIVNQFIIETVYMISTKMSFSHCERFMMWAISFNTLYIYIIFQSKQISFFNNNFNFHLIAKQSSLTPVIHQVQCQIGFIISLSIFCLFKAVYRFLSNLPNKQSYNFSKRNSSNRIYDTNYTNFFDEKKQYSENGDIKCSYSQKDEIDTKINNKNNESPITQKFEISPQFQSVNTEFGQSNLLIKKFSPLVTKSRRSVSLKLESSFYCNHIITITMINCSLLNCIFTYPLILPLGLLINSLLIISLYIETSHINPSNCQTFLTSREFTSITNSVIYIFLVVTITFNFLIGLSNDQNSDNLTSQSLFSSGFNYLFDNDIINQILYIITQPYILYAIIIYLLAFLYQLKQSHKHQFTTFKATISKLRVNPPLSVSKNQNNATFNYIK